jgi:hypothetical protein
LPAWTLLEKEEAQLTNFAAALACRPSLLMIVTWV